MLCHIPLGIQLMGPAEWKAAAKVVARVGQCPADQGPQNNAHPESCPQVSHRHSLGAEVRALPYHGPHIGKAAIEPAVNTTFCTAGGAAVDSSAGAGAHKVSACMQTASLLL